MARGGCLVARADDSGLIVTAEIRLLTPADAEAYLLHRRRALVEVPLAFSASPEDDIAKSVDAVRGLLGQGPDSVVFGAFLDVLVGSVGLYRDRPAKYRHKAHVWGMYVEPNSRKRGIARSLLDVAMKHARSLAGVRQVHLSVSEAAVEARRLYETSGFRIWGVEPESMVYANQSAAECHMLFELGGGTC